MGKGTDKLYITHSEWSSGDQFSASAGAGVRQSKNNAAAFKRLPFNFCALSLQPFDTPVCTTEGHVFDHENIIRWLMKHDTNPTNGSPLKQSDLVRLNFAQNEANDYVDPVTFKVLTDNTHIVAIRHGDSANVFAYDTIERLNIKPKMWKDLVSDEDFAKKDIITLQDPQNLQSRDFNSFKYLTDGEDAGIPKQSATINHDVLGNSAKIARAKEAVAKARAERAMVTRSSTTPAGNQDSRAVQKPKTVPHNASHHTTGLAAASFTSTGVTPHTSAALALLSDEEYLLRRGRVKNKGYVKLETSLGDLILELATEHAPKAVWNFIRLSQKGYYDGVKFHRNIRNFMVQGGDPTGTGKGGTSVWGKNFEDEFDGPLKHDTRGVLSMANKGKDTNSSQFFILYRPAPHLNRKHTIFGQLADGTTTLKAIEDSPVGEGDRPSVDLVIRQAKVLVDPFQEYQKDLAVNETIEQAKQVKRAEGVDDDQTTWTGKRIRKEGQALDSTEVGKYLKSRTATVDQEVSASTSSDLQPNKRPKTNGGFGNFDGW